MNEPNGWMDRIFSNHHDNSFLRNKKTLLSFVAGIVSLLEIAKDSLNGASVASGYGASLEEQKVTVRYS